MPTRVNAMPTLSEFICGGEVRVAPDPELAGDALWADYVFNRDSVPGIRQEWWCHTPSGVWFVAERDTATDTIRRTYLYR